MRKAKRTITIGILFFIIALSLGTVSVSAATKKKKIRLDYGNTNQFFQNTNAGTKLASKIGKMKRIYGNYRGASYSGNHMKIELFNRSDKLFRITNTGNKRVSFLGISIGDKKSSLGGGTYVGKNTYCYGVANFQLYVKFKKRKVVKWWYEGRYGG